MNKRRFFLFFIIVLSVLITGNIIHAEDLGGLLDMNSQPSVEPVSTSAASVATSIVASPENKTLAPANENEVQKIKFKTADDKTEALVIKDHSDHETIEVNIDGQAFIMKARMNKPGVRKYKELSGTEEKTLIAEVKIKDNGFKLVDENDKLLWKVKISDEKVKISDNEENKNPYVLKKSEGKVKVKDKSEKEIARVKFYPENGKLKLKDKSGNELYISKDYNKLSGAIGVLAIKEIPAKLRAVIASELVKQNY